MANYLGYHQVTLFQCPPPASVDYSQQTMMTLRQASVTPGDIYLTPGGLPVFSGKEITLRPTLDPMEVLSGVYPSIMDVDAASAKYGPSGTEYQGVLVQPGPENVFLGVGYGANGIEFTGTLIGGGGGLSAGTPLIDPVTGRVFVFVKRPVIIGVQG